jgi:hypothetical protein
VSCPRSRPVVVGAHGVWGDSRGNLYLAEVGLNQVTNLTRHLPPDSLDVQGQVI